MKNLTLPPKLEKEVNSFISSLEKTYREDLLSVAIYGSAVSMEFIPKHSNLNILVLLKSTQPSELKKATGIVNKFKNLAPLFLTKEYILSSLDIFPIEFLDMQENYLLLHGMDFLKDIHVDLRNLRFQCEQELKTKLLSLKQLYISSSSHPETLKEPLIRSFTSILHILRNILRLKGKQPAYKKEELLKELATNFKIDYSSWEKILAVKLRKIGINKIQTEELFTIFVNNLEEVAREVDAL